MSGGRNPERAEFVNRHSIEKIEIRNGLVFIEGICGKEYCFLISDWSKLKSEIDEKIEERNKRIKDSPFAKLFVNSPVKFKKGFWE